ncbi:predicted protein [Sclerotinia sclerotiorum 1980 UF-70]|uniref:Uncharacterized protein n=1 Tax=Sclerotinia sclerotiorum (strain ATCC 18683 / 1980 / Ss-1) TaxID=665079 RepID=A7EQI7_SCLS1|nr:predicted protein [Sclerotinia sclerotiorum 1980 UF-70]EDN91729.1 predicted protein [Sclerotinia sclerotiorum 1980 UF-70]
MPKNIASFPHGAHCRTIKRWRFSTKTPNHYSQNSEMHQQHTVQCCPSDASAIGPRMNSTSRLSVDIQDLSICTITEREGSFFLLLSQIGILSGWPTSLLGAKFYLRKSFESFLQMIFAADLKVYRYPPRGMEVISRKGV